MNQCKNLVNAKIAELVKKQTMRTSKYLVRIVVSRFPILRHTNEQGRIQSHMRGVTEIDRDQVAVR